MNKNKIRKCLDQRNQDREKERERKRRGYKNVFETFNHDCEALKFHVLEIRAATSKKKKNYQPN